MSQKAPRAILNDEDIRAIYAATSNWGRWGGDDQRGALNYITPEVRVRAAAQIREGVALSCASPVDTIPTPTNIFPAQHYITAAGDVAPKQGPGFTYDYLGVYMHGPSQTHIDALCHVAHDGLMFNGKPIDLVTSKGATTHAITTAVDGIVSRGVLLDIAAARGVDYIEPEDPIRPEDLDAAETLAGVTVGEGDLLLYYTGRHQRRQAKGRLSPSSPMQNNVQCYGC